MYSLAVLSLKKADVFAELFTKKRVVGGGEGALDRGGPPSTTLGLRNGSSCC